MPSPALARSWQDIPTSVIERAIAQPSIAEPYRAGLRAELARRAAKSTGLLQAPASSSRNGRHPQIIVLPWRFVLSDNRRASIKQGREAWRTWADALAAARAEVARQWTAPPLALARLDLVFWWPDNRVRDTWNALKLLGDVLKGTVIVDDRWQVVDGGSWRSAGIDAANPRVEIRVRTG